MGAHAQSPVTGRLSLIYQVGERTQSQATLRYLLVDDRGVGREIDLRPELARPFGGPPRRRAPAAASRWSACSPSSPSPLPKGRA
jgi:hypothetical protein